MTPTDTIIALEKALEAGPTPGEWTLWGRAEPSQTIASADGFIAQTVGGNDSPNAQWIAACSPLAIRTLLDAHASALRDAERLRTIIRGLVENEGAEAGVYLSRGIGTASASGKRWLAARAALDDNTKGAAE